MCSPILIDGRKTLTDPEEILARPDPRHAEPDRGFTTETGPDLLCPHVMITPQHG